MLPSTGYFKGINCPFYDSGLCQRPYCHFRHARKETAAANDGIENGVILQQLVSEAVKKVLQQTDSQANVLASAAPAQPPPKLTYNPTPIAELEKINSVVSTEEKVRPRRHIPVPYTPHRPATVPVKRVTDDNISSKPFIYNPPDTYSPGAVAKPLDPYLPPGTSNGKYEPGSEAKLLAYTPPAALTASADKLSYVPSGLHDKPEKKKKIIEYEPTRASVNAGMSKYRSKDEPYVSSKVREKVKSEVKYRPTPLSKVPCFSSDEEEPEVKKKKASEDENDLLLDLASEFEMLDQILDEEKTAEPIIEEKSDKNIEIDDKKRHIKDKEKHKHRDESQRNKSKSSTNAHRSSSRDKDKRDLDKIKIRSSSKSHKSGPADSHKEKDRDKNKSKHTNKNEKKDNSKPKESSSKSSYKSSEKISKSSSSKRHSDRSKDSKNENNKINDKRKSDKISKKESSSSKEKYHKKKSRRESSSEGNGASDNYVIFEDNLIEEELSDPDEDTIAMECMKIFEEYVPTAKPSTTEYAELKTEDIEEYVPTKKRISRTIDKNVKVIKKTPIKPDHKVNAAQTMAQRLAKIREFHALKSISTNDKSVSTAAVLSENSTLSKIDSSINGPPSQSKVRIAHVPNVSTLLYAKKTISSTPQSDQTPLPTTSTTIVQTIPKGSTRMAHVPNEKFSDRPGVLEPLASKIAANLRSTYLNKMIDECLKIYVTPTDAYARAQQEELNTSKKCTTIPIYKNSAVLAVSRLRKEFQECGGGKTSYNNDPNKISHSQVLIGKLAQASWSIESNKKNLDFSNEFVGLKFYINISPWILDEEQLQQNGFPRSHPDGEKGKAKIYVQNDKQIPPRGRLRTCCRCKKEFMVDKKGFPAAKEDCIYHPNRKYRTRGEVRYQCCSQDGSSEGCAMASYHVFEYVDYDNLRGFVKTMPKDVPDPENYDYGVFALDCEMCYTTHGLDLTRITVINSSCKTVYETLIKPLHPIVDYNTRYSGITEEQMSGVTTTLIEVQATLLSMFSSKTILIGHSLESDFKALKLIHDTVVDTSVLFPHKMGPPYKRALRNLSSEHLKKIIQNSVEGHDSAEDATVCMELIHYKLKEELKLR